MRCTLFTSATGMMAQQVNMDVISNNLANVNTVGFKASRADFQDLLYQQMQPAGSTVATGVESPTGLRGRCLESNPASTENMFSEGQLENWATQLDVAIQGNGFFSVLMPDGTTGYSRDGSLQDEQPRSGNLVNSSGYTLQPEISNPAGCRVLFQSEPTVRSTVLARQFCYDQVRLVRSTLDSRFVNPVGLTSIGGNVFEQTRSWETLSGRTAGHWPVLAHWRRATWKCPTYRSCRRWSTWSWPNGHARSTLRRFRHPDDMLNTANRTRSGPVGQVKPEVNYNA